MKPKVPPFCSEKTLELIEFSAILRQQRTHYQQLQCRAIQLCRIHLVSPKKYKT